MRRRSPRPRRQRRQRVLQSPFRPGVQLVGFLRKDLVDVARQPRLLLVLVAGPFLVLLLFAIGYDQESVRLRTVFVGPEGSIYETAIESYSDDVREYVEVIGFTSDVVGATDRIEDGEVDIVVVFPPDPARQVLDGRQAVITVIHDKLDPIQQTAVEIAAHAAVQELNASVLSELISEAQTTLQPLDGALADIDQLADRLASSRDAGEIEVTTADLDRSISAADRISVLSAEIVRQLGPDESAEARVALETFQQTLDELDVAVDRVDTAGSDEELDAAVADVSRLTDDLVSQGVGVQTLDPSVLVSPFVADTENLLRERTALNDFFAPSALALLLQHLTLTFGALTLVTDRELGLFEAFRVAPIRAGQVLAGKYLSFFVVGASVAALLLVSVVAGLGVPVRGEIGWVVLGMALLILSSVALGLLLSAVAGSDTQAVQFAMIVLLAGMFFGGFFLSLDAFRFPIRLVSWVLPVTYAIRWFQDVMLRGIAPAPADVIGLTSLFVAYGIAGWALFARRLAVQ